MDAVSNKLKTGEDLMLTIEKAAREQEGVDSNYTLTGVDLGQPNQHGLAKFKLFNDKSNHTISGTVSFNPYYTLDEINHNMSDQEKIHILTNALLFYANQKSWLKEVDKYMGFTTEFDSPTDNDKGNVARTALNQIGLRSV